MMTFKRLLSGLKVLIVTISIALTPTTVFGSEEKAIGREIVSLYLDAAPLIDHEQTLQYVNTLGQYIAQFTPKVNPKRNWTFGVLKTDSINAFAAPGGYVLITLGLLNLLETEDQLAFILAHEMSHVVKQHHLKVVQRQAQAQRVIAKMQKNMKSQNRLFDALSEVYKDFATKGLDKTAEHEADLDGALLATRAGFNSYAGQEVMFILAEFYQAGNKAELFYKTHPHPLTRIDMLTTHLSTSLELSSSNSIPSSAFQRQKP